MSQTKPIEVVPYDAHWPHMFEREIVKIKGTLKEQYLAVHHVGSTAVPGLSAKPIIDIITVVKDPEACVPLFESLGFTYKGEFNIPLHYGFSKKDDISVNLHVYPENHPEIELNLMFRDYLRSHPAVLREYTALKNTLLQNPRSFEKNNSLFTGYNLGKNSFIRKTLKEARFNRKRIVKCTHYIEWEAAKIFRQKNFFDKMGMNDPYTGTLTHPDHVHLIFYKGVDIVGYAHIQFLKELNVIMHIICIDENQINQEFERLFFTMIEKWLKVKKIKSIHMKTSSKALNFYKKQGYVPMSFNDFEKYFSDPKDISLGKFL